MKSKHSKTVQQTEVEHKGIFGKLKGIFVKEEKIKPRQVMIAKKVSITKLGKQRKEYSHVTIEQVRKVFRLKKENPHLSNCDIAKVVGVSEVLVRYYLTKGKTNSIKDCKAKIKRQEKKNKPKLKISRTTIKLREMKIRSEVAEGSETHPNLTEVPDEAQPTKNPHDEALENLYDTEKYPVEHQADPKYFKGTDPPQAVATAEAFQAQKRKNTINRAVVAKKLDQDKKITKENESIEKRKSRLRGQHVLKEPKIHFDVCPSCNERSNLSVDEYNNLVRKEAWRRKEWSEKNQKLIEKEKALDRTKQEPSVAEQTQQGTKLCKTCDSRIPYSQATRSYSIYGEYYCGDHMPRL